jgi:hypothetical protein
MGNGRWMPTTYMERAAVRARTGADVFDYSHRAKQSGRLVVHQTLSPQGLSLRESRDSVEHPNSNAILISLDVTGSMGRVVRGIHANLPQLHELLLGHKYISDPQICFAAVGDATCDAVPLQVGQFESDNRMDENLENMILEGGGGGQNTESYELMLYVAARHTAMDCWDKRQRKGYFFVIGDEMAYPAVNAEQVRRLIGPELQGNVSLEDLVGEVKQRFHVYFVVPGGASHGNDPTILNFWRNTLGRERVITLQDPGETSECIALTIGINEGAVDLPGAKQQMQQRGVLGRTIDSIIGALALLFSGRKSDAHSDSDRRL